MPRIIPLVSGWVTWLGACWDASLPGRAVQLFLKVLVCPFRGRKATLHQISEIFVQQTYFTAVEAIPLISTRGLFPIWPRLVPTKLTIAPLAPLPPT